MLLFKSKELVNTQTTNPPNSLQAVMPMVSLLERATSAGTWSLELCGHRVTWSHHLAAMLGLTHESEPIIKSALQFYAPESQEKMSAVFNECIKNGLPFDEEVQAITARGQRLWVRTLGQALHDDSGAIVCI